MSFLDSINPLKLVSSLFKGVKSFTGSNDLDRMKSLEKLTQMDSTIATKMIDWKMSLSANGNWLTKSVRPMIAYSFIANWWYSKISEIPMTTEDYEMFKVVVIFYFTSRGVEKIADKLMKLKNG